MKLCLSRRRFIAASAGLITAGDALAERLGSVLEYRKGGMLYRRLGRTDMYVSVLSFGSHTDPRYRVKHDYYSTLNIEGQARRDRQLARAFDLGVNMVDTYEDAGQWEPVARVVKDRRDKVLVSVCRQFPVFVGDNIDRAAKLYGHVDMYRIYVGSGDVLRDKDIEDWDVLRKAKEAGKVRSIGISTHSEGIMLAALKEFEGMDYVMFPYNFIHARADYSRFMPAAIEKGVGLIAIKPLAAGSIVRLDPAAKPGTQPESEKFQLYQSQYRPLMPQVVAELTRTLDRLPDETLCQAALRFVYSKPYITSAMPGMFDDHMVDENYAALTRNLKLGRDERAALDAAAQLAEMRRESWLAPHYRWLDHKWRV